MKKAKIVATLGPASSSYDVICRLAFAGVDVFRLNFSHGTHETHIRNAIAIRRVEQEIGRTLAIMMDLQGPKIRIGAFENDSVFLAQGSKFVLDLDKTPGSATRVTLPHPEFFEALKEGTSLLLDDGKLELRVEENNGGRIVTEVINGGVLSSRKGVNIPNVILPIPALTDKDKADVAIAEKVDADWVAISFVQTADDVLYARRFVNNGAGILAKIEKPSAVEFADGILNVADAIMVARGDLGVELPYETIPAIQRRLIGKARQHMKPVIVATQMLESMTTCHVPTRAEVSDVACAVAEGADAVMLSAETASGKFPEAAVKTMAKVVAQTELDGLNFFDESFLAPNNPDVDAVRSVANANMRVVAVWAKTCAFAANITNLRPESDIAVFTSDEKVQRRLALVWGIHSFLIQDTADIAEIRQKMLAVIHQNFNIEDDTEVAIVSENGVPL
ncbi:MAG: pyruvate kinase [Alphaproteobacteria bacterium]|nr:pyruvate kinase [Alphaproteobacteria bacterium]